MIIVTTPEEMATEVIKAWISGKSTSAQHLATEIKLIYQAMIDAYRDAAKQFTQN